MDRTAKPLKPPSIAPPMPAGQGRPPLVAWVERAAGSPEGRGDLIGGLVCLGLLVGLFAVESQALRLHLVDRRELQPRIPRPLDQPLLRQ